MCCLNVMCAGVYCSAHCSVRAVAGLPRVRICSCSMCDGWCLCNAGLWTCYVQWHMIDNATAYT